MTVLLTDAALSQINLFLDYRFVFPDSITYGISATVYTELSLQTTYSFLQLLCVLLKLTYIYRYDDYHRHLYKRYYGVK